MCRSGLQRSAQHCAAAACHRRAAAACPRRAAAAACSRRGLRPQQRPLHACNPDPWHLLAGGVGLRMLGGGPGIVQRRCGVRALQPRRREAVPHLRGRLVPRRQLLPLRLRGCGAFLRRRLTPAKTTFGLCVAAQFECQAWRPGLGIQARMICTQTCRCAALPPARRDTAFGLRRCCAGQASDPEQGTGKQGRSDEQAHACCCWRCSGAPPALSYSYARRKECRFMSAPDQRKWPPSGRKGPGNAQRSVEMEARDGFPDPIQTALPWRGQIHILPTLSSLRPAGGRERASNKSGSPTEDTCMLNCQVAAMDGPPPGTAAMGWRCAGRAHGRLACSAERSPCSWAPWATARPCSASASSARRRCWSAAPWAAAAAARCSCGTIRRQSAVSSQPHPDSSDQRASLPADGDRARNGPPHWPSHFRGLFWGLHVAELNDDACCWTAPATHATYGLCISWGW